MTHTNKRNIAVFPFTTAVAIAAVASLAACDPDDDYADAAEDLDPEARAVDDEALQADLASERAELEMYMLETPDQAAPADTIIPTDPLLPRFYPDLTIDSITVAGCTGTGGEPTVRVEVANRGTFSGRGWVDVFAGEPAPPAIGTYSSNYRMSPNINPGDSVFMSFAIDRSFQNTNTWIDVLVDTTQTVTETNESNNHRAARLALPDCSFN